MGERVVGHGRLVASSVSSKSNTSRVSPSRTVVVSSGTIAKQFANARLVTRCEPEPPELAGRTVGPAADSPNTAGMYWARPIGLDHPPTAAALRTGRRTSVLPCNAKRAGRTNASNATNTLTGLPGSAKIGVPSRHAPNPWGFPGCMRTGPNHTPVGANAAFTTSYAPTLTPPDVTKASTSGARWER